MGIGMCLAVPQEEADGVLADLNAMDTPAYLIGSVVESEEGVILC